MAKRNLTKALIENLTYRAGGPSRQVLWDAKVRGFGCRVTPEGGRQYVLLYRINGRQRLMSLGPIDHFKTLDDARTKAGDLLNGLRKDGIDPMAQRERMANAESMAELWKVYERDHLSRQSKNTQINFRSSWNAHISDAIGSFAPAQVTKADLIRLHDRVTRGAGKVSANRCIQRLRAILRWVQERNEAQFPAGWRNPAVGLKLHRELPRAEILDLDQQRALLAALAEEPDPWARAFVQVLMLTGLRAGELIKLTWQNVDLDKRSVAITGRKNGRDLILPLAPAAVELLRALPVVAGNSHVFPSPRGKEHLSMTGMRDKYNAALERAKLPHRTLHDLRRSFGTNIARTGTSTKLIASLLGNTAEITARVYTAIAGNDLRRLTEANAAALLPAPVTP
ncbi:MAG: tyrosine-type recombinase/integrase [Steroidobacteraceae bacterium]